MNSTEPGLASPNGRLSTRSKWLMLGAITLIFVLILLFLAEGAIRIRQTLKYGTTQTADQLYSVSTDIDLREPIANLTAGPIQTNSLGFRGPEISIPKPSKTLRIAFVGASTTWCAEVSSNEKVWPAIVASQLDEQTDSVDVDFINAAVPGYSVHASTIRFKHRVAPLNPDVVVIYHGTNDLSGELRQLAISQGIATDFGYLKPDWLEQYSLLWSLAKKNVRILMATQNAAKGGEAGDLSLHPETLGQSFGEDLTELIRLAQSVAPVVAVATFSTQLRGEQSAERQLDAAASALYYVPFVKPNDLIAGFEAYNSVISRVARETGAVLVDGHNIIPGDAQHFVDTVHFSDDGSEAMANRVVETLRKLPMIHRLAGAG